MTDAVMDRPTGAEDVIWDLSVYYDGLDDPRIEEDIAHLREIVADFAARYRGKVATLDAPGFVAAYEAIEAIYTEAGHLDEFAGLNFSTYSTDPQWGAFMQRIRELMSELQQQLVFFDLEWNAVPDDRAEAILADPVLGTYAYHMEAERRYKDHQLSEAEEKILIEKRVTGRSAWVRLFSQIMAAMSFDWDGETINQPQLLSKTYDADRSVRERAAAMMTAALDEKQMELTYIFNVLAADKASSDRLRNYETWISSRNLRNKAPDEVVEALIETVTGSYDLVAEHYQIKRALLGYDELYDYDRYAPLALKESEAFYTWDEAKTIVLTAYEAFSPQMAEAAQKFFDESWIHAPVMQGKRGGAFASYGTKDTHPFVFVNYTGTANDVMTLAHELGHGVHMYLANQKQTAMSISTPLTTAEMASTFGEMLVFRDLMGRESDDEVKLAMVTEKIDSAFATIYRQVAMNRFEHGMHTARRTEGELTTERLTDIWLATQRDMFQGSVTMRDEYGLWWSYIPHFLHTPGYVYAYAFGELLVMALYTLYQQQGGDFVPKYLDVLAAGDSNYPDRLLAEVGVDLNDPGFWQKGVAALRDLVQEEADLARACFPQKFA